LKKYKKFALCLIRNNCLLLQKEEGSDKYLLPGGKAEEEEGAIQALCREIKEELGAEVDISSLNFLGEFIDQSSGKPGTKVHIDLYQGDCQGQLKPCSEVRKLVWFKKDDDWTRLPPVTRNKILPALIEKGLLT
jgi:8-oxo-dGTP diphosphatase